MKKVISLGLAAIAGLWALSAVAEDESRPYVTGSYSYIFDDQQRESKDGEGAFIGAGLPLTTKWGLEFGSFYHKFDSDAASPFAWREVGIGLDSMYFLSRDTLFAPHFAAGFGGIKTKFRNTGEESTDVYADFGIGFTTYAGFLRTLDLGLRADARYRVVNPDIVGAQNFGETVVRIGLVLPLGDRPQDAAAAAAEPAPATAVAGSKDPSKDSDGDGVTDDKDACPGTARGLTVDVKGCPITPEKAGPNRSFESVNFAYNKSDLTDYAKATLDNAASVIGDLVSKYPKLKVDVSGHTDWVGTDAYNQALSERRANSVKGYLERKGVDGKRINTFSYGESKPLATNDTDEGRAINRRAEIRTHE